MALVVSHNSSTAVPRTPSASPKPLYKIVIEIYRKLNDDFSLCAERTVIRSRVVAQNSPSMRRIMSEWKQVQAEGLAMGEGPWSSGGNSSDTFRLKVRLDMDTLLITCCVVSA